MDGWNDALMGAVTDVTDEVWTVGILTRIFLQVIFCIFLPILTGEFQWVFS